MAAVFNSAAAECVVAVARPTSLDGDFVDVETGSSGGSGDDGRGETWMTRQISARPAGMHDVRLVDCTVPSPACGDSFESPKLEFSEFQRRAKELAKEYLVSGDCCGAVASLVALGCPSFHDELAAVLLRSAMDQHEAEKEAVVVLLNVMLREGHLTDPQMTRGFEKLVLGWEDLVLDVPDVAGQLASLLSAKVGLLDRELFTRLPEGLVQRLVKGMTEGSAKEALEQHLAQLLAFKAGLGAALAELFAGEGQEGVSAWLLCMGQAAFHHEVVLGVCQGCLSDDEEVFQRRRKIGMSVLSHLSGLEGECLVSNADMQLGFSRLLGSVHHAGGTLTCELQRNRRIQVTALYRSAVEAELLPAEFLKSVRRMRYGGEGGVEVVREAQRQTPMHSRRVWGSGDVRHFRQEIRESILEFFDSRNSQELGRIVEELHLSAQEQAMFIRKLLVTGMERGEADVALDATQDLLARCWTMEEVRRGFEQLREVQEDLVLDFPRCRECTTELVFKAVRRGLLEQEDLVCDGATIV